jgi:hypothetical protein
VNRRIGARDSQEHLDPTTVLDLVGYPGAPEGDVEAFLKPATVHDSFAQDLPEADRWLIQAGLAEIDRSAPRTARPSGFRPARRDPLDQPYAFRL